jgi:23S rRNA (cytosine1962-C5)-methyltransferase
MPDPITAAELPSLRLKRNEDRRLQAGHLWVFSNEIDTQQTPLTRFGCGDLVRIQAHNDRALGLAYVNPKSLICARLLQTWRPPDTAWFAARFRTALNLRERLYSTPYYRWVYGESDGLPGLVIDRFGDACVVQMATAGMQRFKTEILAGIAQVAKPASVLLKNDSSVRAMEGLPEEVEWCGPPMDGQATVIEDGLRFEVELAEGQKTGWFFDQAANRRALSRYIRPGARVLDVFSYAGAWGIRAAHSGAASVTCVDSSAAALQSVSHNAALNGMKIDTRQGDAFDVLTAMTEAAERFDVIIVDPPAFAKRKKDIPTALGAYKRINQLAMRLLKPEGILVSCSCSYHVSADDLQAAIAKAARGAGKMVQLLEQGGQAPDHPVHPAIVETRYLKAFFCRVTDELT